MDKLLGTHDQKIILPMQSKIIEQNLFIFYANKAVRALPPEQKIIIIIIIVA